MISIELKYTISVGIMLGTEGQRLVSWAVINVLSIFKSVNRFFVNNVNTILKLALALN